MFQAFRDYSVPVALALLLHAALGFLALQGWSLGLEHKESVLVPKTLQTTLVMLAWEEHAPKRLEQPFATPVPSEPSPPEPPRVPEHDQAEPEQQPDDSPKISEEAAQALREAARQARLRELAKRTFDEAVEKEARELLVEEEGDAASDYVNAIYSQIVVNWSRPPSARNFMSALLRVELFPNGDLNVAYIEESSGDSAFDRSALLAIRKAAPFHVPTDPQLFEARFRQFKLRFRPEDLLR